MIDVIITEFFPPCFKMAESFKNLDNIALCATFLFLPHFDVICDLVLNRCMATWNLFVKLSLV